MGFIDRVRQLAGAEKITTLISTPEHPSEPAARALRVRREVETEAKRIRDLPTWDPDAFDLDLTDRYRTAGGTMRLRPLQSAALYWIEQKQGALLPLAVGAGKCLISLLAAQALNARFPVLLVPPQMMLPTFREIERLKHHFRLPMNLRVIPYSQLSTAKNTDLFERLTPDAIIADEAHFLKNPDTSRTRRFLRHFHNYPNTRFIAMSGTLTDKSLKDMGHLSELALRDGSPLPRNAQELLAWANCCDAEGIARWSDWDMFARFHDVRHYADEDHRRTEARNAFRTRLRSTPGVVASREGSLGTSLVFETRPLQVPEPVVDALVGLRNTWARPDGEELITALDVWRVGMEISSGFYYRWVWPNGEPDKEWLGARAWWHKEVRALLENNQPGLDSPLLVFNAVSDGRVAKPSAVAALEAWNRVRSRPKPPVETVWLSDYMVVDAVQWLREHPKGLVWYWDQAVGLELKKRGVKTFLAGEDVPEDSPVGMALSIRSHGTGLNLQRMHSENLVLSWPSSGKTCEQLIGRTHRAGQPADEVFVTLYAHTKEARDAIDKSKEKARYIEESTGSSQKLNFGTWL